MRPNIFLLFWPLKRWQRQKQVKESSLVPEYVDFAPTIECCKTLRLPFDVVFCRPSAPCLHILPLRVRFTSQRPLPRVPAVNIRPHRVAEAKHYSSALFKDPQICLEHRGFFVFCCLISDIIQALLAFLLSDTVESKASASAASHNNIC